MSKKKEWQFFNRIEELENITNGVEATEATARENRAILLLTFWLAFAAVFNLVPHIARASKDDIMSMLKGRGLSQQLLDALDEIMLKQCEIFDKQGRRQA